MRHSPFPPLDQVLSIAPVELDTLFFHGLLASHHPVLLIQMGKIMRILLEIMDDLISDVQFHRFLPRVYYLKSRRDMDTEKIWSWISQKTVREGNYDLSARVSLLSSQLSQ